MQVIKLASLQGGTISELTAAAQPTAALPSEALQCAGLGLLLLILCHLLLRSSTFSGARRILQKRCRPPPCTGMVQTERRAEYSDFVCESAMSKTSCAFRGKLTVLRWPPVYIYLQQGDDLHHLCRIC